MSGKAEIVFVWGSALILAHGFASGDFQELWMLITKQSTTVANPGLFMRLVGEIVLIVILILASDASDDMADLSLWFLAGLSLLFAVTNTAQLQAIIGFFSGGGQNVAH